MRGAAVLVVEVVGVFPDVEGEEGAKAVGDGVAWSQTQPEPKRPTPLATNSFLKASRVPHWDSIWALRGPVGADSRSSRE